MSFGSSGGSSSMPSLPSISKPSSSSSLSSKPTKPTGGPNYENAGDGYYDNGYYNAQQRGRNNNNICGRCTMTILLICGIITCLIFLFVPLIVIIPVLLTKD